MGAFYMHVQDERCDGVISEAGYLQWTGFICTYFKVFFEKANDSSVQRNNTHSYFMSGKGEDVHSYVFL